MQSTEPYGNCLILVQDDKFNLVETVRLVDGVADDQTHTFVHPMEIKKTLQGFRLVITSQSAKRAPVPTCILVEQVSDDHPIISERLRTRTSVAVSPPVVELSLVQGIRDFVCRVSYSSPEILQRAYKSLFGSYPCPRLSTSSFQYGDVFTRQYTFLRQSQWWDARRLEEYQLGQLRKLVRHAYANVPYYRHLFDGGHLTPDDIKGVHDIRQLPCLTRQDIMENLKDLVARNADASKLSLLSTGATTGLPLRFYADESVFNPMESAFIVCLWNRVGFRFDDKHVVFGLSTGAIPKSGSNVRQLRLSMMAMTSENIQMYVRLIRDFRPRFILASASTLFILGRFMKDNGVPPFPTIKALLLASEPIYDFQRILLEDVFKCRVFSWYGHRERTVCAGECEYSTDYHIYPEYGIAELIRRDGEPVTEDGEPGEIVGTGFLNWVTPFIRYRTGDIATYTSRKCRCGRNYRLLARVQGRAQEYLVAGDGSLLPFVALISAYHIDGGWTNQRIEQIQFLQETAGEIVIRVVKNPAYADAEITQYLLEWAKRRLAGSFLAKVDIVNEIPRTRGGKYTYCIQKLNVGFGGKTKLSA